MRLATWNVNSVRARAERVADFLLRCDIDVLAMQELKCKDEQFPSQPFAAAGYEVAHVGFNQWNGVGIASRVGLSDVVTSFPGQPAWGEPPAIEARAIGATCGSLRVWSLYVPHGRSLDSPHYAYKLDFLRALRSYAATQVAGNPDALIALVGDWNVAPLDEDVWDMAAFEGATHVSAAEREAFADFERAGFVEESRAFVPAPHTYTYWDYQQLRFPRGEGMRIDFGYFSAALAAKVSGASIERNERKGKGASDHVPVVFEISTDE